MPEKYDQDGNSWYAWSKHVLLQLESDTKCLHEIKKQLMSIEKEITALKVKSGIWGAIGGAIPVCVLIIMWLVRK